MKTKILLSLLAVAALAVPAGAIASKSSSLNHGHGPKKATYQLHGTLSAYTAAVGTTPGSITIVVSKANRAGRAFVGLPLTFPVASTTQVQPAGALIADGDLGSVQVKGAGGLDATALQLVAPKQVVDETLAGDDGDV